MQLHRVLWEVALQALRQQQGDLRDDAGDVFELLRFSDDWEVQDKVRELVCEHDVLEVASEIRADQDFHRHGFLSVHPTRLQHPEAAVGWRAVLAYGYAEGCVHDLPEPAVGAGCSAIPYPSQRGGVGLLPGLEIVPTRGYVVGHGQN